MTVDADAPHQDTRPAWTPLKQLPGVRPPTWVNSRYVVTRRHARARLFGDRPQPLVILGISNRDGSARHDWRDFQRIKNNLVGSEAEGLELYPAESRRLDPSNYFLLYVLPAGFRVPLGCRKRFVVGPESAMAPQRRFEEDPGPMGTPPEGYGRFVADGKVGPAAWADLLPDAPET